MLKLLSNENMKIYSRLRTWILLAILCVAIILIAWVLKVHHHADANWKQVLMAQDADMHQRMARGQGHIPAAAVAKMQNQLIINQYEIAHNINPSAYNAWSFASLAQNLSSLLIAFIVVIAGDVVAGEFSSGTIKMLLTQTATRTKILVSKFTATILYALFMAVAMYVLSVLIGGIFFGFSGAGVPQVYAGPSGVAHQMGAAAYLLMQYGFLFIQIIITVTIAFMISAIFRSSALAITISILSFFVGNILVNALSSFSWVKYILFANTDLSQYVISSPMIHGMTLGFSISMLIAYFIVMMGLSWWIFVKRDVAYT